MSKIVVFGASGQLGSCLKKVAAERYFSDIAFPEESASNILDLPSLEKLYDTEKPQFVINCAAYTAVDKAEEDIETARKINKEGAANLAKLCQLYNSALIHVSTDFVFKGDRPKLLSEDDETDPISVYGQTKLEGELAIAEVTDKYFIIRTSWLYSEYGNNFVKTMQRLGRERDELKVIVDQVGTPTYAIDLADAILNIAFSGNDAYGTYHYSNEGAISWYDFAKSIFEVSEIDTKVIPIPTSEYITKARRPAYSVLDKTKIKETFKIEVPYWKDSLISCIHKLNALTNNS
ncbi:dTDP-4-dehydrorhamnose reductase [Arcticibacter tournemirensis]|uniref:dTDP-4-dehydrorhamnose reductase n=1 Tax=Arcticibacter tournemirensis TaxID=699437 RepID=A0A5M9H9V8_9SPHI|nr:dTDP-4-dehydrorhamnose reductase [Arcticibacter tournemirensis]KAA8482034.1 dTDP-4-dehydrorhamnose reductase [Arcticibacter tournemirensis]TQM49439.1 dTDP-4-dehydrorhamnose reductase [Arcticibacter tournemirensis]